MSKFITRVIAYLLTEKVMAFWCLARNPVALLAWAVALALART